MTITDVLHKWFKEEKFIEYTGSDKLNQLTSGNMIRYEKNGGIILYKSSSYGEEILGVFQDAETIDKLLEILIFK